ncbi:MAG TPA: flagellar biosynthesis protein FlhA, partial [Gemmatimonadaceae bacterium]|nr:flagellar biosynthesis protein FlhA [Gemmatimonadaceae bacterium]
NLSEEALRQVTSFPKALMLVAAAVGGLLILPGIPALPTFVLEVCVLGIAVAVYRMARSRKPAAEAGAKKATTAGVVAEPGAAGAGAADDAYATLAVEPIEVHLGARLVPLVNDPGSPFVDRIAAFRKSYALEFGMVLPKVRFRDGPRLPAERYEIALDGVVCARADLRLDRWLAIHPAGDTRTVPGEVTRDPTYGLPALWIEDHQRAAAVAARYTLVDPPTVFLTHLTEVLNRESATLLTRAETDRVLARVRQTQPSLVEELIPTVLSVSDVQKVLQGLLREKVSIRNIEAILETLADAGRQTKDAAQLIEAVRQRLGRAICHGLLGDANALQVMTLDPGIESEFLHSLQAARNAEGGPQPFVLEPSMAEQFMGRLVQQSERMMKSNLLPVLLCSPELRRPIRSLSERVMPHLRVLSMAEVPQNVELKSWGVVAL